jgi:hypothetical protein
MWACDFEFGVTVSGKDVTVTSASGAAKNIEAKIEAGGKKCDIERTITGTIGKDGCLTIKGTVCGTEIDEKICGFEPGAPFCYNLKVSGGGMVAIQVPLHYGVVDSGQYVSADGTDSAKIMLSDKPFGYALLHPLIPEPGKKILFAKWESGYDDSRVIDGTITTRFTSMRSGIDEVKFILLGELRLSMPGSPMPLPFLRDSVYLFAEYPMVYDFGAVSSPSSMPIHSVGGSWQLLNEADANLAGLPDAGGSAYILFTPEGAMIADLSKEYSLVAGGQVAKGDYYRPAGGVSPSLYVKFSRADVLDVTDSLRRKTATTFKGSVISTSFTTSFAIKDTIPSHLAVMPFSDHVTSCSVSPNPTRGNATIAYTLK